MRARLAYLRQEIASSLWLVPGLMILGAIVLSSLTLSLDVLIDLPEPLQVGPEGGRAVLSAIAGSMITVASLVFSLTLIALQLASSQLGPRLITRFMRDRINQVVLGTFLATFLYALLVLRTMFGTAEEETPGVSITTALVLVVISLCWLIYFIHHVADSIQADTVISDVGRDLRTAIDQGFPQIERPEHQALDQGLLLDRLAEEGAPLTLARSGYVQVIDVEALLELACERDLVIDLQRRPGHFVVAGEPVGHVRPASGWHEEVEQCVRGAIVVGPKRTLSQDVEFPISMLVGIALRALSTGINDPLTAITAIDRLTAGLAELGARPDPPAQISDDDGTLHLILHPTTFAGALDAAFDDIRQAAQGQVRVLIRLLEALTVLAMLIREPERRAALAAHAHRIERACRGSIDDPHDLADAKSRLERLREVLGEG
jgi:uncharacterized membrane protein